MTQKSETQLHKDLVSALLVWLRDTKRYRITGADLEGYKMPVEVINSGGVGDGQSKIPDIAAKDDSTNIYVRGEAKTGDGDLDTLHTETQFRLFSGLVNPENKKSQLYVIVPKTAYGNLIRKLNELGLGQAPNVFPLQY